MEKQEYNGGWKQSGRMLTGLIFLVGFIIGAAAMVGYFWATGQVKGRIYLGITPPQAPTPARHPPAHPATPGATLPGRTVAPAAPAPGAPPAVTTPPAPVLAPAPSQPVPAHVAGAQPADVQQLLQRHLLLPVAGVKAQELHDSFNDARSGHTHQAIDIMAPQGTPVLAIDDGVIVKLFNSKPGGLTIYQYDPGQTFSYYYAHLSRYADGLQERETVKRGQVIGYVGSTGDADAAAPHLHFAINRLLANKNWWQGVPIDPYPFLAPAAR